MNIWENILNAIESIRSNKLRASLSTLGIIIGVSSVIIMISIGEGAQRDILSRIESLGTNLISILPGGSSSTNVRGVGGGSDPDVLDDDVVEFMRENIDHLEGISPTLNGRKQVVFRTNNMSTTINGVGLDYLKVNNSEVEYGQYISEENLENMDKVAILGVSVMDTLFPGQDPIGEDIIIEGNIFTVIGVLKEKGSSGFGNADEVILIPVTTAKKRIFARDYYSLISVMVDETDNMDTVKEQLETKLLVYYGIADPDDANFTVLSQSDMLSTISDVTNVLKLFLGGIAGISLIVGGIGVMNIMLVSVTERTREIGIRKAVGAHKKDIILQFLTESVILSVLGGLIGVLISYGVVYLVTKFTELKAVISMQSLFMSFGFAFAIGVIFGLLPAYKAAKLKPIDALRFE